MTEFIQTSNEGFKFFHSHLEDRFLKVGSIRIGTLSGYRKAETASIEDPLEGYRCVGVNGTYTGKEMRFGDPDGVIGGTFGPANEHVDLSTVHFTDINFREALPDYYMFCFSLACTPEVARSFPEYESVARIPDVFSLARFIVTNVPDFRGYTYQILRVQYAERMKSPLAPNQPILDAMIEKPPHFASNIEARIFFVPPGDAMQRVLRPIFIEHQGLARLFVRHQHPLKRAGTSKFFFMNLAWPTTITFNK